MARCIGWIVLLGIFACLFGGIIGNISNLPWKWLVGIGIILIILAEVVSFIAAKENLNQ